MTPSETQIRAETWFQSLQATIIATFETIEDELATGPHLDRPAGRFERKSWTRFATNNEPESGPGGGGTMAVMKGRVFEKVGVNVSTVYGQFSEKFAGEIPGAAENPNFWASGISLVAHMQSPLVPAVHMNTRHIVTTKRWFGGGTDLTPMIPNDSDTAAFHSALKGCCDEFDEEYYPKYKKWCDEYFFLPHRNEARGVGGYILRLFGQRRLGEGFRVYPGARRNLCLHLSQTRARTHARSLDRCAAQTPITAPGTLC